MIKNYAAGIFFDNENDGGTWSDEPEFKYSIISMECPVYRSIFDGEMILCASQFPDLLLLGVF